MPLEVGSRLGHYDVTALIGEGGMGQVYQATDTKLHRDVALKVLPQAFTDDPERLARFEREATVLASLNHPNIGSIYGLEEAEGHQRDRHATHLRQAVSQRRRRSVERVPRLRREPGVVAGRA